MKDGFISLCEVTKTFGSGSMKVEALHGVSTNLSRGERVALLGKSGSGKSTLLHLIGGLDWPTSGSLHVGGQNLSDLNSNRLADYRLATVGMVFQSFNLVSTRTALENVELPLIFAGQPAAARRRNCIKALETVGLANRLGHRPSKLSGGELQLVALARAIVNRPRILLADEPTGNLDSITAKEIVQLLESYLNENDATLLLVTHDDDLAHRLASRILRIHDGRLEN